MKRKVLVSRTENAEVEVEADSDKEARQKVSAMINETINSKGEDAIDLNWHRDGGYHVESI